MSPGGFEPPVPSLGGLEVGVESNSSYSLSMSPTRLRPVKACVMDMRTMLTLASDDGATSG